MHVDSPTQSAQPECVEPHAFEGVVLSGGGTKGILTLGALHYYYEKGEYTNKSVQIYSAASIGTAISLLLLCGYTPMDIFIEVYKTRNLFDIPPNVDIFSIGKNMGILPIESFSYKIKEMVIAKLGFIPTLGELHGLTDKSLVSVVSNVSKMKPQYYKHDTHPTICALRVTELSCCLPVVCHRMKEKDDFMADGGLTDNFPIQQIDDHKRKILAIATVTPFEDNHISHQNDSDFLEYFYRLMSLPMMTNDRLRSNTCGSNVTYIKIKYESDLFRTNLSENHKMDMFTVGYQTAEYRDKTEYLHISGWGNITI